MQSYRPITELPTHAVTNQPPILADYNLFTADRALAEAVAREGAQASVARAEAFGAELGSREVLELGETANRQSPELKAFDRFGQRIDEVAYHPAYHRFMAMAMRHRQPSVAWIGETGGHVSHAALEFLLYEVEPGVCCPMSMTYAGIPALRHNRELAAEWEPKLLSQTYDPALAPLSEKAGCTMGMAMTEKQGGSDVRSNATIARPVDGPGGEVYELTGHKWFCSAPMSDAFLTLAYVEDRITCFFVPRITPEGERNRIFIQRLKDKLGNRSNASSEIEYHGSWARRVGEEGRGVHTIIEMVHHTRLDTTMGAASLMRRAVAEALHYAEHRIAFQKRLIDQPLMRALLADLAVESEAATALALRVARSFDESGENEEARDFARLVVALSKYWLNKRVVEVVFEALEAHGGLGYVEEAPLARIYREAPLNSIWEGSGNVIALDILRTMRKAPEAVAAYRRELAKARGKDERLDRAIGELDTRLHAPAAPEPQARRLAEDMAVALQGALLVQHAPAPVAEAFLAGRLDTERGHAFGTLPDGLDLQAVLERASPNANR